MNSERTNGHATLTTRGEIPHRWNAALGVLMPVAIRAEEVTDGDLRKGKTTGLAGMRAITDKAGLPTPKRMGDGRLLFALPGGRFTAMEL